MNADSDEDGVAIPDETTSLLSRHSENETTRENNSAVDRNPRFWKRDVILLILVYFLLQLHWHLFTSTSSQLKLRSICYDYYREHDPSRIVPGGELVDWFSCYFEEPVHRELTGFLKWERIFAVIPVCLVALPYGRFADFQGKKKTIILALTGLMLSTIWAAGIGLSPVVDVKLIWVTPVFWLIGGGHSMSASMLYLLASERLHEEQRTRLYYYLHGIEILAIAIVADSVFFLMSNVAIYIAVALSFTFLLGSLSLMAFVDESTIHDASHMRLSEGTEGTVAHIQTEESPPPHNLEHTDLNTDLKSSVRSRNVIMALSMFIIPALAINTSSVLYRDYLLTRMAQPPYTWSIPQIGTCLTEVEFFRFLSYLLIMPNLIPWIQMRFSVHQTVIDLRIIRFSPVFLIVGTVLIAIATDFVFMLVALAMFAAGFVLRAPLLSYITSLVQPQLRGRLYGIIQIVESLGYLVTWFLLRSERTPAQGIEMYHFVRRVVVVLAVYSGALVTGVLLRAPRSSESEVNS